MNKRILAAVSGGLDSTVLSNLLHGSGVPFALVHANFQLRGEASDRDEEGVRQLGKEYDVPVFVKRFSTNNYAIDQKLSIQMAARDLRYAWFDELLSQEGYDGIATAHHLNDSLETFISNVVRGTGVAGLTGIPAMNGKIIRPMLVFRREEIEKYAGENKLVWNEDASNATDDYQRNFIRHRVVPVLKEINPSLEETFARNVRHAGAASELASMGIAHLSEKFLLREAGRIIIQKALVDSIKNKAAILFELLRDYGFNLFQCDDIVAALNGQPGAFFETQEFKLIIDRTTLIVTPIRAKEARAFEVEIPAFPFSGMGGVWQMEIRMDHDKTIVSNRDTAILDLQKVKLPLRWRTWEEGDSFFPLGMRHRKKVSDFLIDKKIPLSDKPDVTVLESGGEIAWLVGLRIDERFKVDNETKTVARVEVRRNA